jgi:hypothetical protein
VGGWEGGGEREKNEKGKLKGVGEILNFEV